MLDKLLLEIDNLKNRLNKFRPLSTEQAKNLEETFDIENTFESNRIEGNTLTQVSHLVNLNKNKYCKITKIVLID